MGQKSDFAPYGRWDALRGRKIPPQGVRTFCPPGEPIWGKTGIFEKITNVEHFQEPGRLVLHPFWGSL